MADSYADDAEVDTTTALPDGRRYKGREEFVRYFHEQWDAWAGFTWSLWISPPRAGEGTLSRSG